MRLLRLDSAGRGRLVVTGLPASPGMAVGTAVVLGRTHAIVERRTVDDPAAEWARCQAALQQARGELLELAGRMARELGEQQARIFQAHALVLDDPDLQARCTTRSLSNNSTPKPRWPTSSRPRRRATRA